MVDAAHRGEVVLGGCVVGAFDPTHECRACGIRFDASSTVPLRPKALRSEPARAGRLSLLREPHVAPLTTVVEAIRRDTGLGSLVPWLDPTSGGVEARALLLFEAPGPAAIAQRVGRRHPGSGFVSPDNDDETAATCFELFNEAELDRRLVAYWNIVPWYVGDDRGIRAPSDVELDAGVEALRPVLAALRRVEVVVAVGRKAQRGWARVAAEYPTLEMWPCPHPSPSNLRRRPAMRSEILAVLRRLRHRLGDASPSLKRRRTPSDVAMRATRRHGIVEEVPSRLVPLSRSLGPQDRQAFRQWQSSSSTSNSPEEEMVIAFQLAARLGRSPTTVIRALRRQKGQDPGLVADLEGIVRDNPSIAWFQDGRVRRVRFVD